MSIAKTNTRYKSTQTKLKQHSTQASAFNSKTNNRSKNTDTHSSTGHMCKKLVLVEICVCVENSAVEKQAAAQQISPTSNTLSFKHSQALAHAVCAV
jgi:hypothetical protein